jgi:hypothetical protein
MAHLSQRAKERGISSAQLIAFAHWLDTEPIAPEGKGFKTFGSFTVCGEGELVKTFLMEGQLPTGTEMR